MTATQFKELDLIFANDCGTLDYDYFIGSCVDDTVESVLDYGESWESYIEKFGLTAVELPNDTLMHHLQLIKTGICVYQDGGEGEGEDYCTVWKFTDPTTGEISHIMFNGWYSSTMGVEFDDITLVAPKPKMVIEYEEVYPTF